ncbi:MAG: GAF domain-containing protein [Syntrophales bacterium]
MKDIEKIYERLKINQDISEKFFQIETCILSILNFKDLFEKLLFEIREKFGIPHLWLSMIDKSEVSHLIQALASSEILKDHLNIIDGENFLDLVNHKTKPVLASGDLKRFYKLFPENQKYFIKSIAVVPLTLDGEIIGSLNQADYSEFRYQPGMDTRFLEQLAVKVSICLSNVTAHEKLRMIADFDLGTKAKG